MSEKLLEAIRTKSKARSPTSSIRTTGPDHIGGNERFARSGRPLALSRVARATIFIVAFSSILDRLSDPSDKLVVAHDWIGLVP